MKIFVFYENLHAGADAAGLEIDEVLRQLRDAGTDGIYLSADSWKRDRDMLRECLKKLDLRVGGMFASCDFPSDPKTLRYREIVDLAVESGAENLLLIPGRLTTGNTCRDLDHMLEGMKRAAEYGRAVGMPVLMEDFDGLLAPYNCIAGLKCFLDAVEGLGCAFDTGNFIAFHEDELAAFEMFSDRIQTVHLKDRSLMPQHEGNTPFVCADGEKVYACSVGSGFIRIPDILQKLHSRNYQGNLIIELYACDPRCFMKDALDSLRWLQEELSSITLSDRNKSMQVRKRE